MPILESMIYFSGVTANALGGRLSGLLGLTVPFRLMLILSVVLAIWVSFCPETKRQAVVLDQNECKDQEQDRENNQEQNMNQDGGVCKAIGRHNSFSVFLSLFRGGDP